MNEKTARLLELVKENPWAEAIIVDIVMPD